MYRLSFLFFCEARFLNAYKLRRCKTNHADLIGCFRYSLVDIWFYEFFISFQRSQQSTTSKKFMLYLNIQNLIFTYIWHKFLTLNEHIWKMVIDDLVVFGNKDFIRSF